MEAIFSAHSFPFVLATALSSFFMFVKLAVEEIL